MAAKRPPVGVSHPTVVPANFEPTAADDDEESCPTCGRPGSGQ